MVGKPHLKDATDSAFTTSTHWEVIPVIDHLYAV